MTSSWSFCFFIVILNRSCCLFVRFSLSIAAGGTNRRTISHHCRRHRCGVWCRFSFLFSFVDRSDWFFSFLHVRVGRHFDTSIAGEWRRRGKNEHNRERLVFLSIMLMINIESFSFSLLLNRCHFSFSCRLINDLKWKFCSMTRRRRRKNSPKRWEYYNDYDDDCRVVLIGMCGEISFPLLLLLRLLFNILTSRSCWWCLWREFLFFFFFFPLTVDVCLCIPTEHIVTVKLIVVCSMSMNHRWWEDWPRERERKEIARENERRTMSNSRQNADDNQSSVIIDRRAGDDGKSFSLLSRVRARVFFPSFSSSPLHSNNNNRNPFK